MCSIGGSCLSPNRFSFEMWRGVHADASQFDELLPRLVNGSLRRTILSPVPMTSLARTWIGRGGIYCRIVVQEERRGSRKFR
jgi:hypothetical protein